MKKDRLNPDAALGVSARDSYRDPASRRIGSIRLERYISEAARLMGRERPRHREEDLVRAVAEQNRKARG